MPIILVVDDHPLNRHFLATLLSEHGHQINEAADGAEALDAARKQRPDLIIAGVAMPRMDGLALVLALRSDPDLAGIPIAFRAWNRAAERSGEPSNWTSGSEEPEALRTDGSAFAIGRTRSSSGPASCTWPKSSHSSRSRGRISGSRCTLPRRSVSDRRSGRADPCRRWGESVAMSTNRFNKAGISKNEAIAHLLVRGTPSNLIICDLHVLGRGALEFLQAVKSDAILKDVPFLLISTSAAIRVEERRAMKAGGEGLLVRRLDMATMPEHPAKWIPMEPQR